MRQVLPTWSEWGAAGASALLLILAFPNFELSFLAWIGLVVEPLRPLYNYAWFVGFGAAFLTHWLLMRVGTR